MSHVATSQFLMGLDREDSTLTWLTKRVGKHFYFVRGAAPAACPRTPRPRWRPATARRGLAARRRCRPAARPPPLRPDSSTGPVRRFTGMDLIKVAHRQAQAPMSPSDEGCGHKASNGLILRAAQKLYLCKTFSRQVISASNANRQSSAHVAAPKGVRTLQQKCSRHLHGSPCAVTASQRDGATS